MQSRQLNAITRFAIVKRTQRRGWPTIPSFACADFPWRVSTVGICSLSALKLSVAGKSCLWRTACLFSSFMDLLYQSGVSESTHPRVRATAWAHIADLPTDPMPILAAILEKL